MTPDSTLPEEPLLATTLPAAGGQLGPAPEHFQVEELPLYEASGSGDHWYVKLEKRELTTPELVRIVARAAGVRERDVGYAGLKDKHAVTRQWLSLPGQAPSPEHWELPPGVRLLDSSRHGNKLRTGHLRGNQFCIVLTDLPPGGHARAAAILEHLTRHGLPNYFGAQRFGHGGQNLSRALQWLRNPGPRNRKKSRFHDKLYPSVLQSEVFNRYLTLRYRRGLNQLLLGEVVRLAGSSSVFVVEDVRKEQSRLEAGDIALTGPMFGPRTVNATGPAHALEQEALNALSLAPESLERMAKAARGTRRDLLLRPEQLELDALGDTMLRLSFRLPAGSYATQLVREFTGQSWLEFREPPMQRAQTSSNPA